MRKTFLIIVICIAATIIVRFFWGITNIISTVTSNSKLDSTAYTHKAPDEYLHLFKIKAKLVLEGSDESKTRNTISKFYYDKQFYVQVYKIDSIPNLAISKIVEEAFGDTHFSPNVEYTEDLNDTEFRVLFKEGPKEKVSKLYLTLHGDSTQVIEKNDSVAYYFSRFKNFSIKYAMGTAEDIYAKMQDQFVGHSAPLELLFLKRNNNLYFILLGAENDKMRPDKNLLYNLIVGKG